MTTLTARSSASNIKISILPEWSVLKTVKLTQEVTVNHFYLDSLKPPKPTAFCIRNNEKAETLSNRDVEAGWGSATENCKIIQIQTPEVKIRQFIVNRITLALHHLLAVSHALFHINSWKRLFKKSRVTTPECFTNLPYTEERAASRQSVIAHGLQFGPI